MACLHLPSVTCAECRGQGYRLERRGLFGDVTITDTTGIWRTAHPLSCPHCYCTTAPATTALPPHHVCCKCGDRTGASHTTI